jgi:thiol-disulfide isomerase/thioredoxin
MTTLRTCALLGLALPHVARAVTDMELTFETFDTEVFRSNRTAAFVEFYTSHCGECLKMEEDWEAIGEEHEDSKKLLIGRVNCDVTQSSTLSVKQKEGTWSKLICDRYKIGSYPTILYFTPPLPDPDLFYYRGDLHGKSSRLYDFARNLSQACPASALDTCTPAQREELREYLKVPESELQEAAGKLKYELDMANYERLTAKKELAVAEEDDSMSTAARLGSAKKKAKAQRAREKRLKKMEKQAEDASEKLADLFEHFGHRYRLMRSVLAANYVPPEPKVDSRARMSSKTPKPSVIEHEPEIQLSAAENKKIQKELLDMQKQLFKGKDPATLDWGAIKEQMKAFEEGPPGGTGAPPEQDVDDGDDDYNDVPGYHPQQDHDEL